MFQTDFENTRYCVSVADAPDANPTLNCDLNQGYVPQNTVLECYCHAFDFGQPQGHLYVTRAGNTVAANGTVGQQNMTFTLQKTDRADETLTCVLDWIQDKQSTLTIRVACELELKYFSVRVHLKLSGL
jgi:hypothetical protein